MRNKTLFIYNGTKSDQEWNIYSEGVINETVTLGQVRKSYTLSLKGDATIQFGVADSVYLKATYTYSTDKWSYHTDTPNEWTFVEAGSSISVTCNYSG